MPSAPNPSVLVRDGGRWLSFVEPAATFEARELGSVSSALEQACRALDGGLWLAGFLSYEAAPAFDAKLAARAPGRLPLVWLAAFSSPAHLDDDDLPPPGRFDCSPFLPSSDVESYRQAVGSIRGHIESGETYQVNYTIRLQADFRGDPAGLFRRLWIAQRAPYSALVDLGDHVLCSASPELFFGLDGDLIRCRPMKGTCRRGRFPTEDRSRAGALRLSEKDRAENLMVVDMVRNDLGRIARPGSVSVPSLFELETYPSLFQLTSTVEARTDASLLQILRAVFPSASITGAPKIRTTEIISELETSPRGIYTGSIGWMSPDRKGSFNVAIRTAHLERATGVAEYGTGGGIVWDSRADSEYEECKTKALVLAEPPSPFELFETIRWEPGTGYFLLERHLDRLEASAGYFGFVVHRARIVRQLDDEASRLGEQRYRIRVHLDRTGRSRVDSSVSSAITQRWKVGLADSPVDSSDVFLFHKTTRRDVYLAARRSCPDCDDALLWNELGQVTESTVANLVLRCGDELLTPPVESGLLAGTFRDELLAKNEIRECPLRLEDLEDGSEVYLVNSLRGWIQVEPTEWSKLREPARHETRSSSGA